MKLAKLFNRNENTKRSKATSSSEGSSKRTSSSFEGYKPLPKPPEEDEAISRVVRCSPSSLTATANS